MKFTTLTLVGPGEAELERLGKMLRSLSLFCHQVEEVVLVDDAPEPRGLERLYPAPADALVTSLVNERKGRGPGILGGACTGLLQGLRHVASRATVNPVLKIDTDALVINPPEQKLEQLLAREPELGTAGVVEHNCDGSQRDWEPFASIAEQLSKLFPLKPHALLARKVAWSRAGIVLRRVIQQARRNGYPWGEHSQGGSYLISAELIRRMHRQGFLAHGKSWIYIFMCEDPMMGIYARACGLKNVHFGRAGEVFGVCHLGLPLRPQALLELNYSIAHSTKRNPESEEELYNLFIESRAGAKDECLLQKPTFSPL